MADLRKEVADAVHYMIENLKPALASGGNASIAGAFEDFNALLGRAKKAYPSLQTIQEMKALEGATTVAGLVAKLSAMQGAIIAEGRR